MDDLPDFKLETTFLEDEYSALQEIGDVINFPTGSILMGEGEKTTFVLLIRKGYVKVVAGTPPRIVGIRGPGDMVGEMAAVRRKPRTASVYALSQIEALYLSGSKWLHFQKAHSRVAMAQNFASQERLAESTVKNVESLLGAEQRLAKALVELCLKILGPDLSQGSTLKLSQQELAELAGISLDSVKQNIRSFKARGLVSTGRQSTEILNLAGLQEVASGDSIGAL
jgi:CRP/FNR family cyclic AMP-dependent transcriptional regulator